MDAGYVSAISALAGSAIGALSSLMATWLTQHSQMLQAQKLQDRTRREALYSDFIQEASKLFADAFEHELDDPAKLVQLYSTVSSIRLFGEEQTLKEAEQVMTAIGAAYFAPNKDLKEFANIASKGELDPLFAFSKACRDELRIVRARAR